MVRVTLRGCLRALSAFGFAWLCTQGGLLAAQKGHSRGQDSSTVLAVVPVGVGHRPWNGACVDVLDYTVVICVELRGGEKHCLFRPCGHSPVVSERCYVRYVG